MALTRIAPGRRSSSTRSASTSVTRSIWLRTASAARRPRRCARASPRPTSRASSASGSWASITWSRRSARRASSSVVRNDATRWCGRFSMKPTVSERKTRRPGLTSQARVVVSSVAKRRSSTKTSAPGQRVHQRALAGVRVADERDGEELAAGLDAALAARLHLLDLAAQRVDAKAHEAAVGLELALAGAARALTGLAARHLAGEVGPQALQSRERVLHLRELDLRLATRPCGRACAKISRISSVRSMTGSAHHLREVLRLGAARCRGRR